MSKQKQPKIRTPRVGPGIVLLKRRRAGAHKHRNTPRGGSNKPDHHEGW